MTIDLKQGIKTVTELVSAHSPQAYAQLDQFCLQTLESISAFLNHDPLYLHHTKKEILLDCIRRLQHIRSIVRYASNHSDLNQTEIILDELHGLLHCLENFTRNGAVYLFRHCNKKVRKDAVSNVFKIISKDAIRSQANVIAQHLFDEVLLSPKPVKVIIRHSEMPRAKIFAEIVMRKLLAVNSISPNKVAIEAKFDERIKYSYFDGTALAEWESLMKTTGMSEDQLCIEWVKNRKTTVNFIHQPSPQVLADATFNFFDEMYRLANSDDSHYVIALGFSHAPELQSVIQTLMPNVESLVQTASFVKKECNQYCYLGKWV